MVHLSEPLFRVQIQRTYIGRMLSVLCRCHPNADGAWLANVILGNACKTSYVCVSEQSHVIESVCDASNAFVYEVLVWYYPPDCTNLKAAGRKRLDLAQSV